MMNLLLIARLVFSMSAFKPGKCYQFLCGPDDPIENLEDPCIIVNHQLKTVTLQRCDTTSQLLCPFFPYYEAAENQWQNSTCMNISKIFNTCDDYGKIMTGEQCCNNKNCISGTCLDGKCVGRQIEAYCETSSECKSDSYCKNNACSNTKPLGDPCSTDLECNSGLGCNLGKCVRIFSLNAGEKTDHEKFCMSNFMAYGFCETLTPRIRGSSGKLFPPFMCMQGEICDLYFSNGTHYRGYECICAGYHDLVEGFCGYDLLSVEGVMDQVYQELQYSTSLCTGEKAHSNDPLDLIECESINGKQYTLYLNIYQQHMFYNIYVTGALDACSTDLKLWDYQYSFRDYQSFASILTYLGIFIIL